MSAHFSQLINGIFAATWYQRCVDGRVRSSNTEAKRMNARGDSVILEGRVSMGAGRSIKRLDAGASTAIENCTLSLSLTQVNHVKSIEGNDESTDTKAEQRADKS
jgi:hypothetical protein